MGWIYLILAIILEIFGTSMMKLSNGLTVLLPTAAMFAGYILCFVCLSLALKTIDMSIAYAIWSAVGIILIAIIGIIFFHENFTITKLTGILLIVIGVITVKLSS
ncbi:MAG: multidrug efflux SMR transporter [Brachyspira sp.]|nr:multidrug efflux SMR transporter [Brachyspira sp.]